MLQNLAHSGYLVVVNVTGRRPKKDKDSLLYFFHAFQKKSAAIIANTKTVMPLTSLGDSIMLAGFGVVRMASANNIAANASFYS